MSGHSKWSKVKHQKAVVDVKKGKLFTKLIREITVSARIGGPDPDSNPRLRAALLTGRSANMSSDTMARAVNKGAGGADGVDYESVMYEGYGPANTAVIIEALTDNRNRTAGVIRSVFTKAGGNMGATNSVSYMFDHVGKIWLDKAMLDKAGIGEDALTELVLEAGADDLADEGDARVVTTTLATFEPVKSFLEKRGIEIAESEMIWQPKARNAVQDKDKAHSVLNFIETLEDDDDVQKVFTNLDDDALEQLVGG